MRLPIAFSLSHLQGLIEYLRRLPPRQRHRAPVARLAHAAASRDARDLAHVALVACAVPLSETFYVDPLRVASALAGGDQGVGGGLLIVEAHVAHLGVGLA